MYILTLDSPSFLVFNGLLEADTLKGSGSLQPRLRAIETCRSLLQRRFADPHVVASSPCVCRVHRCTGRRPLLHRQNANRSHEDGALRHEDRAPDCPEAGRGVPLLPSYRRIAPGLPSSTVLNAATNSRPFVP